MHGLHYFGALSLLSALSLPSTAATVFRCEDLAGHVTYTAHGCPTDQQQHLQQADNPTPGSGKPTPMATVKRAAKLNDRRVSEPVVVGNRDDGCGNLLDDRTKREAKLKGEVREGLSRQDIESALGRPDVVSERNGQVQYTYRSEKGRNKQIIFDETGCVKTRKRTP